MEAGKRLWTRKLLAGLFLVSMLLPVGLGLLFDSDTHGYPNPTPAPTAQCRHLCILSLRLL